jgi:hypothetical protein
MARHYEVQGTKSFMIWSIGLALLCIWAIRDGWFPTEAKITAYGPPDNPNPGAHFYSFNQSLAYLSGIGSIVCGFIHKFVK